MTTNDTHYDNVMKIIKRISIKGRMAIALRGIEYYINTTSITDQNAVDAALRAYWDYTKMKDISDWFEYKSIMFSKINENNTNVQYLFALTREIGSSYLYSTPNARSEVHCITRLKELLDIISANGIFLGDLKKVLAFTPRKKCLGFFVNNGGGYEGKAFTREDIITIIEYHVITP